MLLPSLIVALFLISLLYICGGVGCSLLVCLAGVFWGSGKRVESAFTRASLFYSLLRSLVFAFDSSVIYCAERASCNANRFLSRFSASIFCYFYYCRCWCCSNCSSYLFCLCVIEHASTAEFCLLSHYCKDWVCNGCITL